MNEYRKDGKFAPIGNILAGEGLEKRVAGLDFPIISVQKIRMHHGGDFPEFVAGVIDVLILGIDVDFFLGLLLQNSPIPFFGEFQVAQNNFFGFKKEMGVQGTVRLLVPVINTFILSS